MSFLVTGLPRSRTAWFSVVLQCPFEPSAQAHSYEQWKILTVNGASDSAIALWLPRILDEMRPRTLVIKRPLEAVAASLRAFLGFEPPDMMERLDRLYKALCVSHPLIRRVAFDDLDDPAVLCQIAEWLSPGSFDRAYSLMDFNIQASKRYINYISRPGHSMWHMQPS